MTYLIRVEETADYKWLLGLLDRANEKQRTDPNRFDPKVAEHITNLTQAIQNATKITPSSSTEMALDANQQVRKPPRKKRGEGQKLLPNLCPEHKTYGGKYTPRTTCEQCWNVYEKYTDPSLFRQNKAKFERQHGKLNF